MTLLMRNLIQKLTGTTTPFIRILIITYPHTTLCWHFRLLHLLLNLIFSLSFIIRHLGSYQLRSIGVASHFFRHYLYQLIQIAFNIMLNPLKHLSGKLNHLHLPESRFFRVVQLANSISVQAEPAKDFEQISQDQIRGLKSNTESLDHRAFHKFQFDYMVHTQNAIFDNPSTIFDDLSPYQKKIAHTVYSYAAKLNARQLAYLNLSFKNQITNQFPGWNTLHLATESPSRVDLEVMPTLGFAGRLLELKALRKKSVMKQVIEAKGK